MDNNINEWINNLNSTDDQIRLNALQTILKLTEKKVDWVYNVWEELLKKLDHENSYQRSIGIMVLCNLARSDHEHRLRTAADRLLAHTKDEKFITARQCLQNIWKIAAADPSLRKKVLDHLEQRFRECAGEKHYNLIRQDIIQSIKDLSDVEHDMALFVQAQALAQEEQDAKYRKKYQAILKAK